MHDLNGIGRSVPIGLNQKVIQAILNILSVNVLEVVRNPNVRMKLFAIRRNQLDRHGVFRFQHDLI